MNFQQNLAYFLRDEMLGGRHQTSRLHHIRTGRVFFVMLSTKTNYAAFLKDHPDYRSADGVVTVATVYNTLQGAIGACTAGQDDVIYVDRGHTETVTSTSVAASISSVSVVGLGSGNARPTFTFSTAAATITVSAANTSWENCRFIGNFADVVTAFTLTTAKGTTIKGCDFLDNASNLNFLVIVTTNATDNDADGLAFLGNYVYSLPATAGAVISILAATLRVNVSDNIVDKAATNNAGQLITLSSKIVGGIRIMRNVLTVTGATGTTVGILFTGSGTTSSGICAYNLVSSLDTTTALLATAGTKISFLENYVTGAVDKSGTLFPVADDPA